MIVMKQKEREKDIIHRIVNGKLPTYEEAMTVLNYKVIKIGKQNGLEYVGKATQFQMVMAVGAMLREAVWWKEGGSGSFSHSGKVNMGNIATTYFNIASRERQKQAILIWGCGISLIHYCMEKGLSNDPAFVKEIDEWWDYYNALSKGEGFRLHPTYTPEVCMPIGFNCVKDFHIVDGVFKRVTKIGE